MCIIRVLSRLALLAAVCLAPRQVTASDYSGEVQHRITAVEKSLTPAVRTKGNVIERELGKRMQELHVPGVSVAVINRYRIEWVKGYGLADSDAGTRVTTDTLFQAGSVSKPVAALAALKLVERKVLDLDRNVNDQLKSWKVPDNMFTQEHAVELRGLLSHTAGLTVHGFPGYVVGTPLPTVSQILDGLPPANTKPVRVDKVPGHGFRYSGGGTTITQQLVEDVSGKPFATVMYQTVLKPLAMTSSTYEQPGPDDMPPGAATGHTAQGKPIPGRWHIYPEMAAAGLWTTPSDVARYAVEIQLAHEGKSHKILSREMVEQMLSPQGGGPVGLGPFLQDKSGSRYFEHSGSDAGFQCQFVAGLDRGQGAVVMTNGQNGGVLANEVINSVAVVYGWPNFLPPEREATQPDAEKADAK